MHSATAFAEPFLTTRSGGIVWNAAMEERLQFLVAEKNSGGVIAAAISAEFGLSLTRNSIMGKANRMGLKLQSQARNTLINRREPRPPRPKRVKSSASYVRGTVTRPKIEFLETKQSDWDIPQEQRKQFMDLGPHDCRWGVSDVGKPDFFFCGASVKEDSPYCDHHHSRAHWRY